MILLGNRISLISKKNIRYEGTLYSINESNATVALQNVRSYGTEGRETTEPDTSYVPPQDEVHPYLLFRGCDIKDLHVHETAVAAAAAEAAAAAAASSAAEKAAASTATEAPAPPPPAPPAGDLPPPPPQPQSSSAPAPAAAPTPAPAANRSSRPPQQQQQNQNHQQQQQSQGGGGGGGRGGPNRRPRKPNPANQVGTGASLLNRKARGTVEGGTSRMIEFIIIDSGFFLICCNPIDLIFICLLACSLFRFFFDSAVDQCFLFCFSRPRSPR